jgi:hypothetical protein
MNEWHKSKYGFCYACTTTEQTTSDDPVTRDISLRPLICQRWSGDGADDSVIRLLRCAVRDRGFVMNAVLTMSLERLSELFVVTPSFDRIIYIP